MNEIFWNSIENFKEKEFECKCGCGLNNIDKDLVLQLDIARDESNTPFIIDSATRCLKHNKDEKGSFNSSHPYGLAVDIKVSDSRQRYLILTTLVKLGFKRIGVYKNFIHCDVDMRKSQNVIWYK